MTSELLHVRHRFEVPAKPEHGSPQCFRRNLRELRQYFSSLCVPFRSPSWNQVSIF